MMEASSVDRRENRSGDGSEDRTGEKRVEGEISGDGGWWQFEEGGEGFCVLCSGVSSQGQSQGHGLYTHSETCVPSQVPVCSGVIPGDAPNKSVN